MVKASGSLESLRALNRRRVVDALRRHGTLSRADIARVTGLSRSTVSTLVADLHGLGFVVEDERGSTPPPTGAGRPPLMLRLGAPAGVAVGIDFDHTRVRVAVSDLSHTVLTESTAHFDVDQHASGALNEAVALVHSALRRVGVDQSRLMGVAAALAGPVDPSRGRLYDSPILVDWEGVDAAAELRERFGVPVDIDNDANLGALAEITAGAARNVRTAVYAQLSSGVGAGLIVDGRLFRGSAGAAGEIGHLIVDSGGEPCRCGRRGCLETLVSVPAVVRRVCARNGETIEIEQIIARARDGDTDCADVLAEAGGRVGSVLGEVCSLLNPEMVVIGGELSLAGEILLAPLRRNLFETALPTTVRALEIVPGELGDRANLLGALALAITQSEHTVAAILAGEHSRPAPAATPAVSADHG